MRKWLARILDPEMAREQNAYRRMWRNADELRYWCGMTHPEAASAAQLLIDQDDWFWGRNPDTRDLPWRAKCLTHLISEYRNWLDRHPFGNAEDPTPATSSGASDDWFGQVVSFLVEHGMLDQQDEYSLDEVMGALRDNYEPTPPASDPIGVITATSTEGE